MRFKRINFLSARESADKDQLAVALLKRINLLSVSRDSKLGHNPMDSEEKLRICSTHNAVGVLKNKNAAQP
jgi:hypothetical protein